MSHVIQHISDALKSARANKNLSQRELSKATGLPQAQISRIENAAVDCKTSTLIELARALDLEVMLVSRKQVPAVKALMGLAGKTDNETASQHPAYSLDNENDDG